MNWAAATSMPPTFCSARKSTSNPSGLDKQSGVRFAAPLFLSDDSEMTEIAANIAVVRQKIARACLEAARDPDTVNLIAVSKLQPPEHIAGALEAGQRLFGENRVPGGEGAL